MSVLINNQTVTHTYIYTPCTFFQASINYSWTIKNQENMEVFKSAAGVGLIRYSLVFPFAGVFVVSVSEDNVLTATLTISIRR